MTDASRAPEPAILPCPFCGCDAITSERNRNWIAQCGMCNVAFADAREANPMSKPRPTCFARTSGYPTEAEAIAAWNRRSATPASPADVEVEMERNIEAWSRAQDLMEQYGLTDGQILEVQLALQIPALSPSSPREPSEAVVEMMARRDYANDWPTPPHDTWEETDEETRQDYRDSARDIIVKLRAIDFPPSGGTT